MPPCLTVPERLGGGFSKHIASGSYLKLLVFRALVERTLTARANPSAVMCGGGAIIRPKSNA